MYRNVRVLEGQSGIKSARTQTTQFLQQASLLLRPGLVQQDAGATMSLKQTTGTWRTYWIQNLDPVRVSSGLAVCV